MGLESQRSFGENLAKYDIQPIGSRSKTTQMMNSSIFRLQQTPNITRLMKYPIGSVAFFLRPQTARDLFFLQRQMPSILPAHSRTTGFIYGALDAGVKYAHILVSLLVPGAAFIGTSVRADSTYPGQKIEDLNLDTLKATLAKNR